MKRQIEREGDLRIVAGLEVEGSHGVEPSLPQFRRVAVALGQTVVEIHQLLWVVLVGLKQQTQVDTANHRQRE